MINLREVRPEDKELIREWRNSPEVARYMYTDHQISPEEHARWFAGALTDPARHYWVIQYQGSDIGLANLYNIDRQNERCHWAFYVAAESLRGRGLGAYVEYEILEHVFGPLGLGKLCCEVLASNRAVVRLHLGFGFVQEGVFRSHVRKGGEFQDVVCLGILRPEWEARRPEMREKLGRIQQRRAGPGSGQPDAEGA